MADLGRSAHDTFETRLLSHIAEFFPVHWREVGEEHLRGVIRIGIVGAASHGLETQREIYLFVSLMLYLGSYFDTDDQLPWAAAGLEDRSETDGFMRIEATYNSALEYLDRVAGPNGEYATSAIERFTKVAEDLNRGSSVALPQALGWIYPEKVRELSEAALNQLAQQGRQCVQTYGMDGRHGVLLYAGLALLLGHRFAEDPQFSWAAEVLNNPAISDPAKRLTAMKDASLSHLRRWMAGTGRTK